jgi:flagellar basal-body rod protein FlgF
MNTTWNAVAGSVFQMKQLDVTANNLANVDTPGFKGDRISFSSYMAQIARPEFARERESIKTINERIKTHTDFAPGPLMSTGNQLNFAIDGEGYFTIQTPKGEQLTRAGDFRLDDQGQLVTDDGQIVAGEGGPIQIQDGTPVDLVVDDTGLVYQNGEEIGRLRIQQVENPETLVKVGGKRFAAGRDSRVGPMETPAVRQGVIEGSNVNLIREVTSIIQATRAFESYQRIISLDNSINERANQILPTVPS